MKTTRIVSVRQQPEYTDQAVSYFQSKWATQDTMMLYQDSILQSMGAANPLPQWYLLLHDDTIIGCVGLVTNDFISRIELYPWVYSIFVDPEFRNKGYASQLIDHVVSETKSLGFNQLHLYTDLEGFYEKMGFAYNGLGYHLDGTSSRVYSRNL